MTTTKSKKYIIPKTLFYIFIGFIMGIIIAPVFSLVTNELGLEFTLTEFFPVLLFYFSLSIVIYGLPSAWLGLLIGLSEGILGCMSRRNFFWSLLTGVAYLLGDLIVSIDEIHLLSSLMFALIAFSISSLTSNLYPYQSHQPIARYLVAYTIIFLLIIFTIPLFVEVVFGMFGGSAA